MRLGGRVVIVTGAASGIGRGIALRFAREGAVVVVSDLARAPSESKDGLRPTADVITGDGGTAHYLPADVSRWEDVDQLVAATVQRCGRLDVMVNNAAVFNSMSILDTTEDDWDSLMSVNLRGQFLCCKRAIMAMITQEPVNEVRGRIVNVSSQHGMVGPPHFFSYGVSKGGVVPRTRQLAVDYARAGIIVNAVAPGRIVTGTHPGDDQSSSAAFEYSLSRTPFPRLGRVEDVAGAALFLASDDCSFVSGHNLLVDGGWMAY
jgi:NAD(P)-dependent dehydrogenase (short-subunit alcohol dehydrogenase family)